MCIFECKNYILNVKTVYIECKILLNYFVSYATRAYFFNLFRALFARGTRVLVSIFVNDLPPSCFKFLPVLFVSLKTTRCFVAHNFSSLPSVELQKPREHFHCLVR